MRLRLITPKSLILDESVDSVTVPGRLGEMTILPGHAMLVSELVAGKILYRQSDADGKKTETAYSIGPGFIEIQKDMVLMLTEAATKSVADKIDNVNA